MRDDLARFHETLKGALEEQKGYLSETEHELYERGKKLRPLLLLLSARLAGVMGEAPLSAKTISAAVSVEMLHVATLIHDDIIDGAPLRRGLRSVHAERGTEVAILIGDMQFIQAVRCFADQVETEEEIRLVRLVLDMGFQICCGELDELKMDHSWSTETLRERYLQTIDRKTAMMFGVACECGASLAGAGRRAIFYISQFGRHFGRAFQIMDDIFDLLRSDDAAGKLRGTDLAQGRLSLPIIAALDELGDDHKLRQILRGDPYSEAEFRGAIDAIVASKGFLRCYSEARSTMLEALGFLGQFPPGKYREALGAIASYTVNRGVEKADPHL